MRNNDDIIQIHLRKGNGSFPKGFKNFLKRDNLFDEEFEVQEIITKGAIEYIVAGIFIYIPYKILTRIFEKFADEIGGVIYKIFKKYIRNFLLINKNNCEFGFFSKIEKYGNNIELRICAQDLNHQNLDRFFGFLRTQLKSSLDELKLPRKSSGYLYIYYNIDDDDVTYIRHDTNKGKQYVYDSKILKWIDVSRIQYKCDYCQKTTIGPANEYVRFNCCPHCGKIYPDAVKYLKEYFRIIRLSIVLHNSKHLLLAGELDTAVREAIITLETLIKDLSGIKDSYGKELIARALEFEYDKTSKSIIKPPEISLNDLSTISKRNEQEGSKLMLMGFMQWIRNIYMHGKGPSNLYYNIQILTLIDIFIKNILGEDKSIATYSDKKVSRLRKGKATKPDCECWEKSKNNKNYILKNR